MASVERIFSHPIWTIIFRSIASLSLLAAIIVYYRQEAFIRCIADYNEVVSQATVQRAEASSRDRDALNTMLRNVANPNRELARKSFFEYLKKVEESDKQRRENPLPLAPSKRCD